MKVTEHNNFEINGITFVPFRHHRNNLLWMVNVIDDDRIQPMNVVAASNEEAASHAYNAYQKFLIEELKYIEWKEEMKELEKERKELESQMEQSEEELELEEVAV